MVSDWSAVCAMPMNSTEHGQFSLKSAYSAIIPIKNIGTGESATRPRAAGRTRDTAGAAWKWAGSGLEERVSWRSSSSDPWAAGPTWPRTPSTRPGWAGLHEEAGFDRLLVDCPAGSLDPVAVANQVLTTTSGLGVLLAHRPGFVAPTVAARQYATLEASSPGAEWRCW